MKCKNPHCNRTNFIPVLEKDILIGVKCDNCGAIYSEYEIEICKELDREGYWNSVVWIPKLKSDVF